MTDLTDPKAPERQSVANEPQFGIPVLLDDRQNDLLNRLRGEAPTSVTLQAEAADEIEGLAKTVSCLIAVLPQMIIEAATDFRDAYLDGRTPDLSDEKLTTRLHRILAEKFE